MPPQQRIRRDQGPDFLQEFAPQDFRLDGQPAALLIVEQIVEKFETLSSLFLKTRVSVNTTFVVSPRKRYSIRSSSPNFLRNGEKGAFWDDGECGGPTANGFPADDERAKRQEIA
jgi:hypothetical protein